MTVEYLLVMVIAITFIVMIIEPSAQRGSNSIEDISAITKLRLSTDKIVDTLQYASLSGIGTKHVMQIVVPNGATENSTRLACENENLDSGPSTRLRFIYKLKSTDSVAGCLYDDDVDTVPLDTRSKQCTKIVNVGTPFNCAPAIIGPGIYSATVRKDDQGILRVEFSVIQ